MTSYAIELITRERIADWHRQARHELLLQSRRAPQPRLVRRGKVNGRPPTHEPGIWPPALAHQLGLTGSG